MLRAFLSTFTCLIVAANAFAQEPRLTADQIIQRMTDVYSSAKTYEQSGSVFLVKDINEFRGRTWEDVLVVNSFERVERVTFRFYFQRPDHLRFEWTDRSSKTDRLSLVWSNAKGVYSWTTRLDEADSPFVLDKESSLQWAIDEETRGSMSVADILHNALNGSKEFYSFNRMKEAKVIREESISGNACFVILGMIGNQPWALWIDKHSFVLRRYRTQIATGSFDESVRTGLMPTTLGEFNHNDIKVNSVIPKAIFDFKPLLRKGDIDISKYEDEKVNVPFPPPPPKKPD